MNRRWMACVSVLASLGAFETTHAQGPSSRGYVPSGCRAHVRSVPGGQIDWCDGFIIAEGKGKAEGRTENDRLMAKRAAETVAARNALLLAMDIQIDVDGRFADIRNAEVTLKGSLKGHETIAEEWRPNAVEPELIVKVRVPLWGVEGAASMVYTGQVQKALGGARRRVVLSSSGVDVSDAVLIIDARGTGVQPCLFPTVAEPDGVVLYDVGTLADRPKQSSPTVRYVETKLTASQLRTNGGPSGHLLLADAANGGGFLLAALHDSPPSRVAHPWTLCSMIEPPKAGQPAPPTSQPTSGPTSKPAEGPRRRKVVKAAGAAGKAATEIVLTKEDVEKLRQDPEGAALLRSGQVIVVVDSQAAGIEGRRDAGAAEYLLALTK